MSKRTKRAASKAKVDDVVLVEIVEPKPSDIVYTSHDVGKMLKCNPTSVNKWAADGKIICYVTPGGHRRFTRASVEAFAKQFGMPLFELRGVR